MNSLVEPQFKTALELLKHPPVEVWCPYSSGWVDVSRVGHPFPFVGICTRFKNPSFIVPVWVYEVCMQGGANCPYKNYKEEGA